jgi:hypothetical protein
VEVSGSLQSKIGSWYGLTFSLFFTMLKMRYKMQAAVVCDRRRSLRNRSGAFENIQKFCCSGCVAATLVGGLVMYAKSMLLISGHLQGQELALVREILCSYNATDVENAELLFGTFHICDSNIKQVSKFICSIPLQAHLIFLSFKQQTSFKIYL